MKYEIEFDFSPFQYTHLQEGCHLEQNYRQIDINLIRLVISSLNSILDVLYRSKVTSTPNKLQNVGTVELFSLIYNARNLKCILYTGAYVISKEVEC